MDARPALSTSDSHLVGLTAYGCGLIRGAPTRYGVWQRAPHPHARPPATGPYRLPVGPVVRSPSPLSPPDRVPARGGTPPGDRQTHHPPLYRPPPAACRVSASCRALPSPNTGAPPLRDDPFLHRFFESGHYAHIFTLMHVLVAPAA